MRIKIKTPTGRMVYRQKKERPAIAKCANCKSNLHGISRKIPNKFKKLAASERKPERPYGGYLCSSCTREVFRERIRSM